MRHWRPALRMARRDLLRHRTRAVLTMLLVALPVVVGTAAAQLHHNSRWEGERQAREVMGGADALVQVTPYVKARVAFTDGYLIARPGAFTRDSGERQPVRRDPSGVEVENLLPRGSRVIQAPESTDVRLASGGRASVLFLDVSDPMSVGFGGVDAGRAPSKDDEVAVPFPMADELDLVDAEGGLLPDATLDLMDGPALHVVGIIAEEGWSSTSARLLAPPDSVLHGGRPPREFLVDLPAMSAPQTRALVADLADSGVAAMPRDVVFHPRAWGARVGPASPVDPAAMAIGALVVLFGLVEVVLIVGSAFAVSARRQVRDLGLLASSGGSPADLRRVVLAQGLVLGVGASVLGAAAGIGLSFAAVPLYERVVEQTIWMTEVDWFSVAGVTVLGSLTGVVAALLPAWSIGRLTPVAALSGRFPLRSGEAAAHRPAFVLVGAGLSMLVLGGLWTAREYSPRPGQQWFQPSPLPVALGALGLLLLVGGAVWCAPYVVRRVAALGRFLPLSGRFAFRDAARHRFRTAASVVTVAVTVAGALFAGFVVDSVSATSDAASDGAPQSLTVYLDDLGLGDDDGSRVERVTETVEHVVGPVTARVAYRAHDPRKRGRSLTVRGGWSSEVRVVDEETLRFLVGDDERALRAFRSQGVVTTEKRAVRNGIIRVGLFPGGRRTGQQWRLPAVVVSGREIAGRGDFSMTWMSRTAATELGLVVTPSSATLATTRPVTHDDMTRLSVYGIEAWSPDPDQASLRWLLLGVVGVAGLLTAVVVGIAVALASAEGRADAATMAAVGAGPWRRRALGAMHGVFLGVVGALLGLLVGVPAGISLMQVDGLPGLAVPWGAVAATLAVVPLLGGGAGWVVTPRRLPLVRRAE